MSYAPHPDGLRAAFAAEPFTLEGRSVQFVTADAGQLHITSGKVAGCDPLADPDFPPFTQHVPNGAYPVTLAVARFDNDDERIAYARVQFDPAPVANWYPALIASQDARTLKAGDYFGYGVDSGTGCFMDPAAGQAQRAQLDQDEGKADLIAQAMDANYRHTRSWCNVQPVPEQPENLVCFSTGWGDGCYPSFFGYDSAGRVVALLTDCCVVPGVRDEAPPRRRWWQRLFGRHA